ncbi:hypothetical protein ACE1ET_02730 [Saccharicrinis sp. FJH62]|uniref:hypothetical protein n=1 Tax=Saccharicrinis sp. FJH62 TaxID=3344657 RepID=UPI0035D471A0
MKKSLVITLMLVFSTIALKAQPYQTSIGLRMGFESGITLKHFVNDHTALEGIFSTRWNNIAVTGLYEVHNEAFDIEGLMWYYGGGAHAGFGNPYTRSFVAGLDGIVGLEYTFRDFPVDISVDWKPSFDIVGRFYGWFGGTALTVRYNFK